MSSESSRTVIDEILSRISVCTADMSCSWERMDIGLLGSDDQAACLASRTAASVRTNFARHLVHRADELRDRRLHRADQLARAARRATAGAASAAISLADITWPGIAPPVITNLSLPLAKSFRTFATATGSVPMPYGERADHLVGQRRERRVGDGPAHQGVLDHPEVDARSPCLRAKLRHRRRRACRGSRPSRWPEHRRPASRLPRLPLASVAD